MDDEDQLQQEEEIGFEHILEDPETNETLAQAFQDEDEKAAERQLESEVAGTLVEQLNKISETEDAKEAAQLDEDLAQSGLKGWLRRKVPKALPILTKFEYVKLIGTRAIQLADNYPTRLLDLSQYGAIYKKYGAGMKYEDWYKQLVNDVSAMENDQRPVLLDQIEQAEQGPLDFNLDISEYGRIYAEYGKGKNYKEWYERLIRYPLMIARIEYAEGLLNDWEIIKKFPGQIYEVWLVSELNFSRR